MLIVYRMKMIKMMEINYGLLPKRKHKDTGEYVIKNAFYIRDECKRKTSRMYPGYHKTDYFGSSFLERKINKKNKSLVKKR